MDPTHTVGGKVDPTAIIGHAPEHRDWCPGDPSFSPVISPSARIEAYVTVDAGCENPTYVGRRVWLMKHVHVGHDAYVSEGAEIAPGAVICGHAFIGNDVRIGVNASILPGVSVSARARIGAGAVVTKDVGNGEVWVGNPARFLRLVTTPV